MISTVKIVFGKEQVNKVISNIELTDVEKAVHEKEYKFETKAELDAFCKGIEEAIGWNEYYIVEQEYLLNK
jgi:hypothetical protein